MEHVHVLLVRASGKGFPHRAAEVASPVAGQFAFFSVLYVEEVAVFPVRVRAGLLEPFMFIGTVVYHQVHENVHTAFFCLFQQVVHILHGAEGGVDFIVIRDIITLVCKRRCIDGGNPDDVHTQIL